MRKSRSLAVLLAFALLVPYENLLILFKPAFAQRQERTEVTTETAWGLHTVTIDTLHGKVRTNLPDDMAEGDTISGTVVLEPKGKTQAEREKNLNDMLAGYVVEIEKKEIPLTGLITPLMVAGLKDLKERRLRVALKDQRGKEIASADVPVKPPPPPSTITSPPKPEDYTLPKTGQAGRPFEVKGPCNGDFNDTEGRFDREKATLLAESPRKAVFLSTNVPGLTEFEFTEGNVTTKTKIRNVAVRLTAQKTELLKGEETTLTIEASGLEGLQEELQLLLTNKTPGVVRIEGGDVQFITIRPGEVQPDGTYTVTRTITGIRPGGFAIACHAQDKDPLEDLKNEIDQLKKEEELLKDAAGALERGIGPEQLEETAKKEDERAQEFAKRRDEALNKGQKADAANAEKGRQAAERNAQYYRQVAEKQREALDKTKDEKGRPNRSKAADELRKQAKDKRKEWEAKKKEYDNLKKK